MLQRIKIQGLGPHLDFRAELDPRGENTVTGPSEAGKSFLVEAVAFALFGRSSLGKFRPEAIHDGQSKALVELTLDSGRTIRRTITRSRSQTRTISLAGMEESYSTENAFAEALGELGQDPEAVMLVSVPQFWQELSAGNARKLRDALARILPGGDLTETVRELVEAAGQTVSDEEAGLDDKRAGARRREARRLRDEAEGRLQLARERLTALQGTTLPDPGSDKPPTSKLIAKVAAWEQYDRSSAEAATRAAALTAQADWDSRREALGEAPAAPEAASDLQQRAQQAQLTQQTAMQTAQQVQANLQMVTSQLQMFGQSGPDVCPMCQRDGWDQGAAMVAQLQTQSQELTQQAEAAQAAWQAAQQELAEVQQLQQAYQAELAAAQAYQRSLAALGPRPEVPDEVSADKPKGKRPKPEDFERVRQHNEREAALAHISEQHARDLAEAGQTVKTETARVAETASESERWDAILDAVRAAPSELAAAQARALGDLGPVSLEFGDNPAVSVLIDERPWWLASRGRQVVADACLRTALRRALQMPWLPLFVDNIQDVGGQPLPAVPGPVVWLQTTDGKGIFVRRRTHRQDSTSGS